MSTVDIVLAAALFATDATSRPAPDSPRMEAYKAFAGDIQKAAASPLGDLPFSGPAAVQATEDALIAIVENESHFKDDVRTCKVKGDKGMSISGFQLYRGTSWQNHKESEICNSPELAAKLAINILGWYATTVTTVDGLFAGYARGVTTVPNKASAHQTSTFRKLVTEHKIKLFRKKGEAKIWSEFEMPEVLDLTNEPPIRSYSVTPK